MNVIEILEPLLEGVTHVKVKNLRKYVRTSDARIWLSLKELGYSKDGRGRWVKLIDCQYGLQYDNNDSICQNCEFRECNR